MDNYVKIQCTTNDRGLLIPLEDYLNKDKLNAYLNKLPNSDWYSTLFYYPKEIVPYFEQDKSIRGYSGKAYSKSLVWDFDCDTDVSKAQKDTITLLERLQSDSVAINSSVSVWYSGSKGFHVSCALNEEVTPDVMKTVCSNLAKGLETYDAVIYNATRIFRIPNTKHQKTGLYKIEIEPDELLNLTIEQIKQKASRPSFLNFTPIPTTANLLQKYQVLETKIAPKFVATSKTSTNGIRGLDTINWKNMPKNLPRCIYALQHGIAKPGERENVFFRLANFYRNQGFPKEVTGRLLKGIAELNHRLYPEAPKISKDEIWNMAVASAYREGGNFKQVAGATGISSNDDLIKNYCDCLNTNVECILHSRNNKANTTIQIDQVADWFTDFAKNYDTNIVRTGIKFIDENMRLQSGASYLLVGSTGSGKTTLSLNIMENANKLGQYTMFFSLDMEKRMVYLKLAQKLTKYSQREIFKFYKENNVEKMAEIKSVIAKTYSKTYFDFSSTLTADQMRDKVLATEERTKNKIKLVIVDYAGRMAGPFSDTYANAKFNALKSKEVADLTDATWIFIAQISRNTGDSFNPLRTKRCAKESGDWEDAASGIITMWRPYAGIEGRDNVMRVFLAKNRMGPEIESLLYWDGEKSSVRDMTEDEFVELDNPAEELNILKSRLGRT